MRRRAIFLGIAVSAGVLLVTPWTAFSASDTPATPDAASGPASPTVTPANGIVVTTAFRDSRPFSLSSALPPATPLPTPPQGIDRLLTLADSNQTIMLARGMHLLLALGDAYTWAVQLADPAVLATIPAGVPPGTQGLFVTQQAGATTLTAIGEPQCRAAQPPCLGAPTLFFTVRIVVG